MGHFEISKNKNQSILESQKSIKRISIGQNWQSLLLSMQKQAKIKFRTILGSQKSNKMEKLLYYFRQLLHTTDRVPQKKNVLLKSFFKFTLSTFGPLYQNFHLKEDENVDFYELNVQHDGNQNVLLNTPVSDLIDPKIRQASSLITMTHRDTSSDSLISKLKFIAQWDE